MAGFSGTVGEDMAQVGAALGADGLGPDQAVSVIGNQFDHAGECLIEAGPTGTGVKFGVSGKKRLTVILLLIN